MYYSKNWKNWIATKDLSTCLTCRRQNGKIYAVEELVIPEPPIHPNCRCKIKKLEMRFAGTATKAGLDGADWHLKVYGKLPRYYITKKEAESLGYRSYLGNLAEVAPDRMLIKGIYQNRNEHLPTAPNRVWYEADINYDFGYRGSGRILFSNDGLIFVTYDHYHTFVEIE